MSQGWSKIFNRINWLNRPSTNTPLNATNLNAGDSAIDKLDDRIITLDTVKADMQVVNGMVADISVNDADGVITVTYKNGSTKTYDTNLEKIATNFTYDYSTQRLVLTLSDGSKQYVDMSALITQYEFKDSTTIAFSVDKTGKISAFIKNGSITDAMLETGYLANITAQATKAESMANSATTSSNSAYDNAKLSQSYAIGGSGVRDGEDTDNSKYYSEQASKSASASANSASTASTKASEAATSASSASASATKSATSESNASKSASSAATSESTASTKASEAAQSATSAGNSAFTATSKASAASTSASNAATSEANAKKYYEQAKAISESFSGALRPMGTVTFANLPAVSSASAGDMYNISDEFVTTSDFVEGAGITEPAGSNVYKTETGKWDVLAGSPVTGVKGANETSFRRGNVNITPDNIGAIPTTGGTVNGALTFGKSDNYGIRTNTNNYGRVGDATNQFFEGYFQKIFENKTLLSNKYLQLTGDSKDNTTTFTSNDSTTGDSTAPALLTSGETHASIFSKVSTIFKNVRWLLSKMGTTDISSIGNGTVTGALSTLNSNISSLKRVSFFGQAMADADYGFSATTSAPCHGYAEEIYPNHFNIHLEMKIARGSEYQNNNQVYEVFAMHFLTQQLGVSTINWNPYATRASIYSNANLITNHNEIIGRSGLLVIKNNNNVYALGRIYDNSTYGGWGHDSGLYKANVGIMIDIYDAITL